MNESMTGGLRPVDNNGHVGRTYKQCMFNASGIYMSDIFFYNFFFNQKQKCSVFTFVQYILAG